jgi:hypothetical protein
MLQPRNRTCFLVRPHVRPCDRMTFAFYSVLLFEIVIRKGFAGVGLVVTDQGIERRRMRAELPADFFESDGVDIPNVLLCYAELCADLSKAHCRLVFGASDYEGVFAALSKRDQELPPPAPRRFLESELNLAGAA